MKINLIFTTLKITKIQLLNNISQTVTETRNFSCLGTTGTL